MDPTVAGLIGVVVGVIGTIVTAKVTASANAKLAVDTRLLERDLRTKELAAEAYVSAVEAVQWLRPDHVEDSVDPKWEAEYRPKTERAVLHLREARASATKVAALGGPTALRELAAEVAVALGTIDDAWHDAQDYRTRLVESTSGGLNTFLARQFDLAYERLTSARQRLTGFDGSGLAREEIDQGGVGAGSLLDRFREASASRLDR